MARPREIAWWVVLWLGLVVGVLQGGVRNGLPKIVRPNSLHAGLIDSSEFQKSIQRVWSVSFLRQFGHSIRVMLGTRLPFVVAENSDPLMLFVGSELPLLAGLTDSNRDLVQRTARRVAEVDRAVREDGWKLVVVPVPAKLSVERNFVHWPLRYEPSIAAPVGIYDRDRSEEVSDELARQLTEAGVATLNVHRALLASKQREPDLRLFPAGESHWSEAGIWIAATETARVVRGLLKLPPRSGHPVLRRESMVADLAGAFDVYPALLSRLAGAYWFEDAIVEKMEWDSPALSASDVGVVVVGTSYSGQYVRIANTAAAFPYLVGEMIGAGVTVNAASAGKGSYYSMQRFLDARNEIHGMQEAEAKNRKFVIWEFPLRDMVNIAGALNVHSSGTSRQSASK